MPQAIEHAVDECYHTIVTLRTRIPCFRDRSTTACVLLVQRGLDDFQFSRMRQLLPSIVCNCLWHFGDCFQFDKMPSNIKHCEVWVVNLVSVCREQNHLLSGPKLVLKKSVTLDFQCPKVMQTYYLDAIQSNAWLQRFNRTPNSKCNA